MEGTQEALSGKMRLLFTPAARTSLLMLRLNEAALRALQECQQQQMVFGLFLQVRPVIAFQGQRGYLRLPGPGWSCLFSFIVSQCGQEGGGLDLVYQRLGRNHTYLSNREPDQPLPSSASQKRLDKKRSAPITTEEPEEKRPRALPLASSPLQGLSNQDSPEEQDWGQDADGDSRLEQSLSVQSGELMRGRQYSTIHSAEQQQAYEQDFETDYAEYRILHARVGAASQRFTELGAEIKRLQRGTPEHKVLEDKIVQEYKKFRKRYPSYSEEKRRCEYLHEKLSHIKGLILEFEEKNRGS
ncbi:rCG26262, isoform CRA_a [Rattus norvegicus]|uniref:RCG26262, isoform CRA_a n=1 Tax=Rattus norvegicus TaxID=10116 RepID=A6HPP2_RAT|nr:rCG26262, isoform CRA_a [Rattus norvegicus]